MKKFFNKKSTYYYIFIFSFFLIISLLMPYGGDDWNNLLDGKGNLSSIINIAISDFMTWEGRFFSRICLGLLVPRQIIWSLLNASIMTFIVYTFTKIINPKNNTVLSLFILSLLLINSTAFAQVYVWKTGNITYLFPMFYLTLLFYFNFLAKDNKLLKYIVVLLALPFSMFVENVSVSIVIVCLAFTIYTFIKNKKINIPMLLSFVLSLIGLILMITSPGTRARLNYEGDFSNLSILGKFIYNIPSLINYTYIKNAFLLIIIIYALLILINKYVSSKKIKLTLSVFVLISALTSITQTLTFITRHHVIGLWRLLMVEKWYVIVYWLIFTIIVIYFIIKYLKDTKDFKAFLFFLIAIISNGSMMISPVWGERTAFLTTIMLYLLMLSIINKLDDNFIKSKKTNIIVTILIALFSLLFTIYAIYYHDLVNDRDNYIKRQIKDGKKEIEVIITPSYYTWNVTPWGEEGFLVDTFKYVMGIDKKSKLILVTKKESGLRT